jgi:ATP-dependent DNA helicase RecG
VLTEPISSLGTLKRSTLDQLERLGLRTVHDLVRHYPYRYEDMRSAQTVAQLRAEPALKSAGLHESAGDVNLIGIIQQVKHIRLRGRVRAKTTAIVDDGTGQITAIWFGRPYLGSQLRAGQRIFLRGRVEATLAGVQMLVARHRVVPEGESYTGELVPVYPLTSGLTSYVLQRLVTRALQRVLGDASAQGELDPLPEAIAKRRKFADARWALRAIHQPKSLEDAERARKRLIFEEFFLLALAAALRRAARQGDSAPDFSKAATPAALAEFHATLRSLLPFALTGAQERVIDEIAKDLAKPSPMNRLLQGDVGSGKTAVAAAAVLFAARAGYQSAFMAPTEILAAQQFANLTKLLSPAGVRIAMLVGALRRSTRDDILDQLRRGELDIAVGTHALLTQDVEFARLGLVVIDEQHRFGVMQRAALRAKAKQTPHTLVMTATPIPRTLAQTVYADLDISVIDELPPGRKPPKTFLRDVHSKEKIFAFIRDQVQQGRQAYVVCAAIDETERAMHTAVKQAEELRASAFKGLRVALLHGKLSGPDKEKIMRMFADGFLQILIATTVVEVGVDVPNATVMLIFDAQSFGLAQLHQLRGRVGRGAAASYCILVATDDSEESARLRLLEKTNDGFAIAEEDAKIRGSGDMMGTRQHGDDRLRIADLIRDYKVFLEAKKEADALIARDPGLGRPEHAVLAAFLAAQDAQTALRATS